MKINNFLKFVSLFIFILSILSYNSFAFKGEAGNGGGSKFQNGGGSGGGGGGGCGNGDEEDEEYNPPQPDHPDDTEDVSTIAPELFPSPNAEIAILQNNLWRETCSFLQGLNIKYAIHKPDDIPSIYEHPIVCV